MRTADIDHSLTALSCGFGKSESVRRAVGVITGCWSDKIGAEHENSTWDTETAQFRSEITSIHLRGMGLNPVLLLGQDCAAARQTASQFLSETLPGRHLPIVVCTTDSAFECMRWRTGSRPGQLLLLSRTDLRTILVGKDPVQQLRRQILNQIPFQKLVPFTPANPAEGGMFFGRETELGMLVEQDEVDCALCGPGGIGKTSLLRQTRWLLRRTLDSRATRIVEVDLLASEDANAAAREIAQRISHTRFAHDLAVERLPTFLRHTLAMDNRFHDGAIDLIIDEADGVLERDSHCGYPLLRALRHAKNQGLVRVTICGRVKTREALNDRNNPFHGRMKLLEVRPLDAELSTQLLTVPLEHLGVQVTQSNAMLSRLLAGCQGVPLKIHHLGVAITQLMSQRQIRRLTVDDMQELDGFVVA